MFEQNSNLQFISNVTHSFAHNRYSPAMDKMTTTKSKMFHPLVKKYCRRANSFNTHSPVKTTIKATFTLKRKSSFSALWLSVSTIMVTIFRQMSTMMKMSKNCWLMKSNTIPWIRFCRSKGDGEGWEGEEQKQESNRVIWSVHTSSVQKRSAQGSLTTLPCRKYRTNVSLLWLT